MIGFSFVVLSKEIQGKWIPKSFLIGAAVLMLATFWISNLNKGGLQSVSSIVIAIFLVIAVAILVRRRKYVIQYFKMLKKFDIVILFLCFFAGLLPLSIYVLFGAQQPYCDGYTYICNADYLLENGYKVLVSAEELILHPWLSQIHLYQEYSYRIGAQMLLSLFSGFFHVEFSLELFLPTICLGVFLCGASAWTFETDKIISNFYVKILVVLLMVLNIPIIFWNAIYGFLPQTIGSAFCLAAVIAVNNIERWENDKRWNIMCSALMISALALSYNEMLPFFVLITIVQIVRICIVNRGQRKYILQNIVGCGIVSVLFIIIYVPGMVHAILSQFGATVGWNQNNKDFFSYLAYFFSTVPADYDFVTANRGIINYALEVITLVVFALCVVGWNKSDKKIRTEFLCTSLPYMGMLVYFMFLTVDPFTGNRGNAWSIYKLAQYFFIVAVPYLATFIGSAIERVHKYIFGGCVFIFVLLSSICAIDYADKMADQMRSYVGEEEKPIKEYYNLYERYGESEDVIALRNVPDKHRQMITYFLKDVKLVSNWDTDGYYLAMPEIPEKLYENCINLVYDPKSKNSVAGMTEKSIDITFGKGFYDIETSASAFWRWSKKESSVEITRYSNNKGKMLLECGLAFYGQGSDAKELNIYDGEMQLLRTIVMEPGKMAKVSLELDADITNLNFVYSGQENVPNDSETREIAFMISDYVVTFVGDK